MTIDDDLGILRDGEQEQDIVVNVRYVGAEWLLDCFNCEKRGKRRLVAAIEAFNVAAAARDLLDDGPGRIIDVEGCWCVTAS